MQKIEDGIHFALKCPAFLDIRRNLIYPCHLKKTFQLIQVFRTDNIKTIQKLCQDILRPTKHRE